MLFVAGANLEVGCVRLQLHLTGREASADEAAEHGDAGPCAQPRRPGPRGEGAQGLAYFCLSLRLTLCCYPEFAARPFVEWLRSRRLSGKLLDYVLYSIAQVDANQESKGLLSYLVVCISIVVAQSIKSPRQRAWRACGCSQRRLGDTARARSSRACMARGSCRRPSPGHSVIDTCEC